MRKRGNTGPEGEDGIDRTVVTFAINRPLLPPRFRLVLGMSWIRRYTGILALAAVLAIGRDVRAATLRTWDGSASATWSNNANWSSGNRPDTQGEVAVFSSTQVNNPVNGNLTCTIGRIKFSAGGWDINDGGGVVTIVGNDGTGSVAVQQTSTGYTDIYIDIVQGRDDLEWSVASGGTLRMRGVLSGAAVKKTGSGLLRFYGANTYSGLTTINGGTLQLGASGCIPDDSVVWVAGTSVTFDLNNYNETVAGIQRNGVVDLGSGTLTINVGSGEAYSLWDAGSIIGTGDLIKTGEGTQRFLGTCTYSGATTVSGGTLQVGNGGTTGTLGSGTVTVGAGATLLFNRSDALTVSNTFGNPGNNAVLRVDGSGIVTIDTGDIGFSGTPTIYLYGSGTGVMAKSFASGGAAGTVVKTGSGTWRLASAANGWGTGGLTISSGTIQLGATDVIPNGSGKGDVTLNPSAGTATLDLNGYGETINGLSSSGAGSSVVDNTGGAVTLTVGDNDQTSAFGGVITDTSGALSLTKTGSGTFTLSGANTYSGGTTVEAGTLAIGAGGSLANTPGVTVSPGAVFDVSAAGFTLGGGQTLTAGHTSGAGTDVNGDLTSGGTIDMAGSGTYGTLTLNGGLALTGGNLAFDLSADPSGSNDKLVTGNLDLSGSTTVDITFASLGAGTYTLITFTGKTGAGTLTPNYNGTFARGQGANLVVGASSVDLVVTVTPLNLVWAGGGVNNTWDTATTPLQWLDGATPTYFANIDTVSFTATGSASTPVDITEEVFPGSVVVNADTDYAFTGSGKISGTTGLTKSGNGTLTIGTANEYAGVTAINGGGVSIGAIADGGAASPIGAATSDAANLVLNTGKLTYTGATAGTDRGLTLLAGGGTLDVTAAGADLTVGGLIVGSAGGGLTKAGDGTLTLTRDNTYDGATIVGGGALVVEGTHSGGGAFTVQTGATLGGGGSVSSVTVNGGGWLSPGSAAVSAGTLTTGSLTLQDGARLAFELGTTADKILVQGDLDVGTDVLGFSDFTFTAGPGFGPSGTYVLIHATTVVPGTSLDPNDSSGLIDGLPFTLVLDPTTAELVLISGTGQGTVFAIR